VKKDLLEDKKKFRDSEQTKKNNKNRKGNRKPKTDPNNPLDLGRAAGVRRPDWLLTSEEGEHDKDQFEFLMAMDEYKKRNSKPFPTLSETLFVVKTLGYEKDGTDAEVSLEDQKAKIRKIAEEKHVLTRMESALEKVQEALKEKDTVFKEKVTALKEKTREELKEKDNALKEKDTALEEKTTALEEKTTALEEKTTALKAATMELEENGKGNGHEDTSKQFVGENAIVIRG